LFIILGVPLEREVAILEAVCGFTPVEDRLPQHVASPKEATGLVDGYARLLGSDGLLEPFKHWLI
jgi:hypothetical protein